MRPFRCRECGEESWTETVQGPLPSVCTVCDPEAEARRAEQRAKGNARHAARTAEVQALRDRIVELEAALRFDQEARARALRLRPGRDETPRAVLGRMVRRLAHVQGRRQTAEALLDVAAAARSWARTLAESDDERQAAA